MTNEASTLIIGAAGGIGGAVLKQQLANPAWGKVIAVSSKPQPGYASDPNGRLRWLRTEYDALSIRELTEKLLSYSGTFRQIIICNGFLHDRRILPEKRLQEVDSEVLHEVFQRNAALQISLINSLRPLLDSDERCTITVLSARVGSIEDNKMGGWYAYRAAKAALNMFLKTAAIEFARTHKHIKLVAFHPGTTDTQLSKPFQAGVPAGKLFEPKFVAERIIELMEAEPLDGDLSFIDWAGEKVPF